MDEKQAIQNVIISLNQACEDDPIAIHSLICNRVPCNEKLVDHPHIVVTDSKVTKGFHVGALGLINGVLGSLNLPHIAIKWTEDGKFIGFCEYIPPIVSEQVKK